MGLTKMKTDGEYVGIGAMARALGVTRSRVSQLLSRHGAVPIKVRLQYPNVAPALAITTEEFARIQGLLRREPARSSGRPVARAAGTSLETRVTRLESAVSALPDEVSNAVAALMTQMFNIEEAASAAESAPQDAGRALPGIIRD